MTLHEVFPYEFSRGEYVDTIAFRLKDVEVVEIYSRYRSKDQYKDWPGPQKNVDLWVILANGKAVGFNENMSRGWSFPVIGLSGK